MDNETLFYACGVALAVSAVLISIAGLKAKNFPGKAFPVVILWFAILVGGATTFAVLHAKDEEKAKSSEFEQAGKEFEAEGNDDAAGEAPAGGETAKGPGGTLQLAADQTELAYDKEELSSSPGKVTIEFTNPSTLEHNVAIDNEKGILVAASDIIGKGKTSISAELEPGPYKFFCAVPGHREAGMEGFLFIK
jgi:plastocyanin